MIDTPTIVRPIAFDHKSKMRLREHGEMWEVKSKPKFLPLAEGVNKTVKHVLLQSVETGHMKWWPEDHINVT